MDLTAYKSVYFLGIGGIGMSAIARYFNQSGILVSGYDKTRTPLTDQLIAEGMDIHFEENPELIPDRPGLVVYTPAIPQDSKELAFIISKKYNLRKRSEVLGMITHGTKTIAVAGTHGKTTTTALIAHILMNAGKGMVGFLGGVSKNYFSNILTLSFSTHNSANPPAYYVVEADEFDRSFLQLFPDIAVITSTDADHLDIYKNLKEVRQSFQEFISQIQSGGKLILKKGTKIRTGISDHFKTNTYSVAVNADFFPICLKLENGKYNFDLVKPGGKIKNLTLGLPGMFNLENAVAAMAVAVSLGIPEQVIADSLASFEGVERRFDFQVVRDDFVYIDDYAHHPEELKACIRAVREIYPKKKVTGIFQPHLFSRTRDFADEFARSLELLDELILLEIYPARENPIPGVDSAMLLNKVNLKKKILCTKAGLLTELKTRQPEVLLTMGAGDIDQLVAPIKELYTVR